MEPIKELSKRLNFQRLFADGKIVNIGCGENPALFPDDTMHVDLDVYKHKNFTRADAHHLPFKDDEFDTAVLGDMLEHCPDPVQVLKEAARVAKKVVATIFEEWRLKEMGTTQADYVAHMEKGIKDMGFKSHYDYLKSLPTIANLIESVTPDSEIMHHPHIHEFKDDDIHKLVSDAGLELSIYHKFVEGHCDGHTIYNWVIVARKRGGDESTGAVQRA